MTHEYAIEVLQGHIRTLDNMSLLDPKVRIAKAVETHTAIDVLQAAQAQVTAKSYKRPQNCGTNFCSCIECVMKPEPVAYLAWRDGKPCYEGDDAVCEDAVWPVDSDDDRTSTPVYTHPPDHTALIKLAVEKAYEAGWVEAACWAKREDLIADIDSPSYVDDRAAHLDSIIGEATP